MQYLSRWNGVSACHCEHRESHELRDWGYCLFIAAILQLIYYALYFPFRRFQPNLFIRFLGGAYIVFIDIVLFFMLLFAFGTNPMPPVILLPLSVPYLFLVVLAFLFRAQEA